jgi:hypothetical protein
MPALEYIFRQLALFSLKAAGQLVGIVVRSVPFAVGCHFFALSEGENNKSDQQQSEDNGNYRLHHGASRQLASASSDNCRGCGSIWVMSVSGVG